MNLFLKTLTAHRVEKTKITIYLKSGIQLNGVIIDSDDSAVILSAVEKSPSCITIDSIATVKVWEPTDNSKGMLNKR